MKKITIIFWTLMILVTACSNDDDANLWDEDSILRGTEAVTFSQDLDEVSVLIFRKNINNQFIFKREINSGWIDNGTTATIDKGKVTTDLEIGNYKFLFLKSGRSSTIFSPELSKERTNFDGLQIEATPDPSNPGYILPVDELWLPESFDMANREYEILNPVVVSNKLKRVVSQIELTVKTGYLNGDEYVEIPSASDEITNIIEEVQFDISGLGEAVNINGSIGSTAKTIYKTTQAQNITATGATTYEGPFVFPPEGTVQTDVVITLVPKATSEFPLTRSKTISEQLLKNQKLAITLWITDTYQLFNVTVDITPISEPGEGDEGIWE